MGEKTLEVEEGVEEEVEGDKEEGEGEEEEVEEKGQMEMIVKVVEKVKRWGDTGGGDRAGG